MTQTSADATVLVKSWLRLGADKSYAILAVLVRSMIAAWAPMPLELPRYRSLNAFAREAAVTHPGASAKCEYRPKAPVNEFIQLLLLA